MYIIKKIVKRWQKIENRALFGVFLCSLLLTAMFLVYTYKNTPNRKSEIFNPSLAPIKQIDSIYLESSENTGEKKLVSLPIKLDPSKKHSFHFKVKKESEQQYLAIGVHYTYITLKYQDEVLYTNKGTDRGFSSRVPNAENLIPIPFEYTDKELTLECSSTLDSDRKIKIPTILVGSKHEIIQHYIKLDNKKMFSAIFLIILGILLILFALFLASIKHSFQNILAMALFTITSGIYILSRTWTLWYYLDNARLSNFLEYSVLMAMPLPVFLLFLNSFYETDYSNWRVRGFEIASVLVLINLITQSLLVFLTITEFVVILRITHLTLISSTVFIIFSILTIKNDKIKNKKQLVLSIIPLLFATIFTIVSYYISYRIPYVSPIIISLVVFILIHFIMTIQQFLHEYNESIEHKFYSQLAYTDILTNLKNRNAFEKEVETIKKGEKEYENFCLFIFDMNNLKYVNDTFGHTEGDFYLKEIGTILQHIEKKYKNIFAYRYAGDEFVMISYDSQKKTIDEILSTISHLSKEFKGNHNIELSIATGYYYAEKNDTMDFDAVFSIADKKMYTDKSTKSQTKVGRYEQ